MSRRTITIAALSAALFMSALYGVLVHNRTCIKVAFGRSEYGHTTYTAVQFMLGPSTGCWE